MNRQIDQIDEKKDLTCGAEHNNYGFGADFLLSPDFIPGGKRFNTGYFGEVILSIQSKLKEFAGTLSKKRKKGRIEYYLQYRRGGKRREVYVKKKDVNKVLLKFEKKKRLKSVLFQLKTVLAAMPREMQRAVRSAMAVCKEEHILDGRRLERRYLASQNQKLSLPGEVCIDGMHLRSRNELVCWEEAHSFGLKIRYEPAIFTRKQIMWNLPPYNADFVVRRRDGSICYWEHMGRLDEQYYADHQRQKLRDYRDLGICVGQNLIITTSKRFMDARRMLWAMVCGGLITAKEALKKLRKRKKSNRNNYDSLRMI